MAFHDELFIYQAWIFQILQFYDFPGFPCKPSITAPPPPPFHTHTHTITLVFENNFRSTKWSSNVTSLYFIVFIGQFYSITVLNNQAHCLEIKIVTVVRTFIIFNFRNIVMTMQILHSLINILIGRWSFWLVGHVTSMASVPAEMYHTVLLFCRRDERRKKSHSSHAQFKPETDFCNPACRH